MSQRNKPKPFEGEHIWIIGASSGIGEALARELAAGGATLVLSARREEELIRLQGELGAQHLVYALDVSNHAQVVAAAQNIAENVPILNRVIFMAATYRPNDIDKMDADFAKIQVDINVMGAIYCAFSVLPIFDQQQSGQLVLCGSMAGYIGLPGGQPYCATKAAVNSFAESLYAEANDYVDIKLICPGFVRTRITDKNNFPMPMLLEPAQAAKAIAKGIKGRAFEIHFPKAFTCMMKCLRLLPYFLSLKITRAMRGRA